MQVRYCSLIIGLAFLLLGIAGFIPGFVSIPDAINGSASEVAFPLSQGFGYLFGIFPTNYFHNAIHIVVGILGIAAFTSFSGSVVYLQGFAIAYVAIALMGIIPFARTTFGTMPVYGANVPINLLSALVAGYYGFFKAVDEVKTPQQTV